MGIEPDEEPAPEPDEEPDDMAPELDGEPAPEPDPPEPPWPPVTSRFEAPVMRLHAVSAQQRAARAAKEGRIGRRVYRLASPIPTFSARWNQ